ncbi:DUF5326 family protein [Streptomyces sp. NBC_00536]|uniref:DUF5326 family protein n=1 Tax=Streptomyces sp. NBC_00536 TaxID=2975769 RepID=UPI002E81F8E7|nr:DUF5326 family protein [Streptomyces sp. NBC_00536]WUC83781.1 DUF5326 family protein [Streptomyces sp. NBC_00536]
MRETFAGMPWWVKWVAVPLLALFVFGGALASILGAIIGLIFKVLLFAGLVGGLIFVVKKFTGGGSKSSSSDW